MQNLYKFLAKVCVFLVCTLMIFQAHAALPTLTLTRVSNPMIANQEYTITWKTTGVTSLSYNCTANGSGFIGGGKLSAVNGSSQGIANPGWVNYPSNCTWTAVGPGGTINILESLVTKARAPTINVTRVPSPMIAGKNYTVAWTTTDATSVAYNCTSNGSGFAGISAVNTINGSAQGVAPPGWVGYPSNCIWVVAGPGGTKTFSETLTTVKDPSNQGDIVGRDLLVTGLGWMGHVGIWDGKQVIEVLNESDVVQINNLDSFKRKSTYWGAVSPKITPYLVDNCFQPRCTKFWPVASGGQIESVQVQIAIVQRALQIDRIGADYTIGSSYKSAWAGDANHGSERGKYRCDTFVEDLYASTIPYGNIYMTNKSFDREWGNKIVTMRDKFSPILPLTLFQYFK
jgi:hypothetical protein